ncbi:MAG: DUF1847 domain-containing protein [Methanomicrobia archaeon]|nr:DUF1847 domain-containing protein [Methanomicrobia archaeon]
MRCAACKDKACATGKDCCTESTNVVKATYASDSDVLKSLEVATQIESRYYMQKTRVEELILYAQGMGYKKLGVAFCIGLAQEAATLCAILERDFEVSSVCCKLCGIDKAYFGLERLHAGAENEPKSEAMCNPIGQALILNRERTDLNIILGLCIGHDTIFTAYSEAPVTTLAVKDRVLAHNPLGALYSNYYLSKLRESGCNK